MNRQKIIFFSISIVLMLCTFYVLIRMEYKLTQIGIAEAVPDGKLTDVQATGIKLMVDLSTLIMNWTFAIFGGIGLFLKLQIESKIQLKIVEMILIFATLLLVVSSLYFAQIGFDLMVRSLTLQQFPLGNNNLHTVFRTQFLLGITALISLGLLVFSYCWRILEYGQIHLKNNN